VIRLLAAVASLALGIIAFAPGASAKGVDNVNDPSYWQGQGWGSCVKYDPTTTPFNLGSAPSGSYWSLLVLKAGSEASNSDWLTQIENPAPGTYYHPSGKTISHAIVCKQPGSGPATTTTTTSTPGGGCGTYMPTNVAITASHGEPGDPLTVTGTGIAGDIVTVSLSGNSQPVTVLGSTSVGPTGSFSVPIVIPNVPAGSYTLSVASSQCPTPRTLTLIVDSQDLSGCGPNGDRIFEPGDHVTWVLMGAPFDTSKPVSLVLSPRGPGSGSTTLYSGPFPASGTVNLTIPNSVSQTKLFIDQIGVQKNNKKTMTKSCPVRVDMTYVLASSSSGGISGMAAPAGKGLLVLVAGGLLFVLRSHRPRRRRR
jgi:hypothetical protein